MLGKTVLFSPGFDHAGISTQSVVEKRLYKSSGKTRHDLGREKFIDTVMDWKNESVSHLHSQLLLTLYISYQERITNQLHRLGGSYDWSRAAFTMSPVRVIVHFHYIIHTLRCAQQLSKAVIENFCRLHEDGILYRANRLVNWCVQLNTTLSNLEVRASELHYRVVLDRGSIGRPKATNWTDATECPWV